MISNKKVLYSERLLQLVLALSLLQVDPINYLEWGVPRIHRSGIGPWQMEVAHTPFSDHVYMNRKTYVPLIEDLARFDRFHTASHDVQAYLLNFDNPSPFIASSDSGGNSDSSNNAASTNNNSNSTSDNIASRNSETETSNLLNLIHERIHDSNVDDLFLQSDIFQHNESLIEQNLADLQDYEDHRPASLSMPLKSEPYDPWDEILGQRNEEEAASTTARVRTNGTRHPPPTLVRSAVIDWHDYLPFVNDTIVEIKQEPKDEEESEDNIELAASVVVKKEESDDDASSNNEVTSNVELTLEVSFEASTRFFFRVEYLPFSAGLWMN